MCRNIKQLHNFDPPATDDEVHAAALQYVRKISGTTKPSKANEAVFERAVREIAHISRHLLDDLVTSAPPRDREVEAARARARAAKRFGTPPPDGMSSAVARHVQETPTAYLLAQVARGTARGRVGPPATRSSVSFGVSLRPSA